MTVVCVIVKVCFKQLGAGQRIRQVFDCTDTPAGSDAFMTRVFLLHASLSVRMTGHGVSKFGGHSLFFKG
jgi:hypothetical protein